MPRIPATHRDATQRASGREHAADHHQHATAEPCRRVHTLCAVWSVSVLSSLLWSDAPDLSFAGPLKELSDPEDPQMPQYALVPDDVARNFRCVGASCLMSGLVSGQAWSVLVWSKLKLDDGVTDAIACCMLCCAVIRCAVVVLWYGG